jgi:FlaA1/EpsC-like NDP-sugar epimerase
MNKHVKPSIPGAVLHLRNLVTFGVDAVAWAFGIGFATVVDHTARPSGRAWGDLLLVMGIAVAVDGLAGRVTGLYTGRFRYGGFDEIAALAKTALAVTAATLIANEVFPGEQYVPRAALVLATPTALLLAAAVRYAYQVHLHRSSRPENAPVTRLLIMGAGDAGYQVVSAMLRDPGSHYLPVALLDDDPRKRHRELRGVPVVGTRDDLLEAVERHAADGILIAIPSASSDLIAQIGAQASQTGLPVMVLPAVAELIAGRLGLGDIRSMSPADLLGRHEVETDVDAIAGYITGKRVLVTGAGGSIGSELCRQLLRYGPADLLMLDRDESALHGVQLSIEGRALLDSPSLVLLDIRDDAGVHRLFDERRPEVVFHAAALKHLPLLERHPGEAVMTNVLGTQTLLDAAVANGVEHFVNISTDKAADPASVLGYSKRLCERLTAAAAEQSGRTYLSVRFGNVLGSRGSMLETFQRQVEAGGPITVTDPEVTRYFMTVEEAVQLVIQAGAVGAGGEVLVLEMGDPVRIDDVARMLASQSEQPIEIVYTGLREGEKLHEELFSAEEEGRPRAHPMIRHVSVPPIDAAAVQAIDPSAPPKLLIDALRRHATGSMPIDAGGAPPSEPTAADLR